MKYLSVPTGAAGVAPVSMSTTSAQSAALAAGDYVCVVTVACCILRGANPTATTSCLPLAPNEATILRGIQNGEKIAFITPTGTGTALLHPAP